MRQAGFPPWVVLHLPHDSTEIPEQVRGQFLLSDQTLDGELLRMTDHFTASLFTESDGVATLVRSPVSRLVVDVERFADDQLEPMASRGMGAIYEVTSGLDPLRRQLSPQEKAELMEAWYFPHHERLERAVEDALARYNQCLVLDCHSFPSLPLPYEMADLTSTRPDICIGIDEFHTDQGLALAFVTAFQRVGWQVGVNEPFGGAMVPSTRYRRDSRVSAVMVEVNRSLYMDERVAVPISDFDAVARQVRHCCFEAIAEWRELIPGDSTKGNRVN
jgi:N-formylglutamate deformylase